MNINAILSKLFSLHLLKLLGAFGNLNEALPQQIIKIFIETLKIQV
jgi:hypothetical protein